MTTEERISRLEGQIERLEAKETELRRQLAKAQLDQWYARIEDLELQAHLGAMETHDRVSALVAQVRNLWKETKHQVDGATHTAGEAVDEVRGRIEGLLRDVRRGLADAQALNALVCMDVDEELAAPTDARRRLRHGRVLHGPHVWVREDGRGDVGNLHLRATPPGYW